MGFLEGQTYESLTREDFPAGINDFEGCVFKDCTLDSARFEGFRFTDCEFRGCNLSLVNWSRAFLADVRFVDCKLTGARFDQAEPFNLSLSFDRCHLDHSLFIGLKIPKTAFVDCRMCNVDFSQADLNQSVFDKCDLTDATFSQTDLRKADFRSAINFTIDPAANKVMGTKFGLNGLHGLLSVYKIQIDNKF